MDYENSTAVLKIMFALLAYVTAIFVLSLQTF